MRSLVMAIVTVGVGLAGLIITVGLFLASGQRQTQEQLRLLAERVASLETTVKLLHPSPMPAPDAK